MTEIRGNYVFDAKRIDLAVCREQAQRRAKGDIRNTPEPTMIHIHHADHSCLNKMHERINIDGTIDIFAGEVSRVTE